MVIMCTEKESKEEEEEENVDLVVAWEKSLIWDSNFAKWF